MEAVALYRVPMSVPVSNGAGSALDSSAIPVKLQRPMYTHVSDSNVRAAYKVTQGMPVHAFVGSVESYLQSLFPDIHTVRRDSSTVNFQSGRGIALVVGGMSATANAYVTDFSLSLGLAAYRRTPIKLIELIAAVFELE